MQLTAHPTDPGLPIASFDADARREHDGSLRLRWRLAGDVGALRVPDPAPPQRLDDLWHHTCFEAFIAVEGGSAYAEFNFSPSGSWAAYAFTGFRQGMRNADLEAPPECRWHRDDRRLDFDVTLRPLRWPVGAATLPLRLGLTAVIEDRSGTITYWALRHPGSRPEFHHPDGFVLGIGNADTSSTP
jgi:hypothetical protein